jgi:hypothetical protein
MNSTSDLSCRVIDGVAVGYRFSGEATFSRLLSGETAASRVGGPKGLRSPAHSRSACPSAARSR